MKFTLVFPPREASDLSYGLVFIPSIVWMQGNRKILNPHKENPHYLKGDFQQFFIHEKLDEEIAPFSKDVVIIVHEIGHGTKSYLALLKEDIIELGFNPIVLQTQKTAN